MYLRYSLTARLDGETRRSSVEGSDADADLLRALAGPGLSPEQLCDHDAAMSAIPCILNLARKDPIWSRGEVVLSRHGRVIHRMEAR